MCLFFGHFQKNYKHQCKKVFCLGSFSKKHVKNNVQMGLGHHFTFGRGPVSRSDVGQHEACARSMCPASVCNIAQGASNQAILAQ